MEKVPQSLLWIFDGSLTGSLDRATWMETAAELSSLGWHVTIMAADAPPDELDRRVELVCISRPRWYILGYLLFHLRAVVGILHSFDKNHIVMFNQKSALPLWPLLLVRRMTGRNLPKFVMDSRTLPMGTFTLRDKLMGLLINLGNRLGNRWADGQTAISARMAETLKLSGPKLLGIWPSGAKIDSFSQATKIHRRIREDETLRLVYAGTLSEERNLLALCEAVRIVRREGLDVTLDLVGDGPQKVALHKFASGSHDGAIIVRPAIPHSQMPFLLIRYDIGVLPFPDLERFRVSSPVKLFEYMAAGMPVLATRIACHTDVAGDEPFVFWAESTDPWGLSAAIREAWTRRTDFPEMGNHALDAVQRWTWRESAVKLAAALEKALSACPWEANR